MRVLTLGASGEDVSRWERFLVRAGTLTERPSGFFGPAVAKATEAFQDANALPKTGAADERTLAAALGQGLLDPALDDPRAPEPAKKDSAWLGNGALFVAVAAGVLTFLTNVAVEWSKNNASILAEREKLRSSLIQQALQIAPAPNGAISWTRGQAELEAFSRLEAYVRLGLVDLPQKTLDDFLHDLGSVPVVVPAAAETAPPSPAPPAPIAPALVPPNPPPVAAAARPQQRVFVQFANMRREDVIALARSLGAEWRVQGATAGGERTGAAAGKNEVRWGDPADEDAAKALAAAVERSGVLTGHVATARNQSIARGTLELWISG